jgi:hypothetical protein
MSSIRSVGRSAAARNNDRASLCSFTFADGRRCRTPRQSGDLQFCSFHARKQAQAQAAEDIGRDARYFFSGRYLSACDLNAALGRVFVAVAHGDLKPKTASALAYLAQVMVQCIQITQHEYAEAFGGNGWRNSISSSVNSNSDYLNPPEPVAAGFSPSPASSPAPQSAAHPSAPVGAGFSPSPAVPPPAPQAAPSPRTAPGPTPQSVAAPLTPLPPTSAEFVQQVVARPEPIPLDLSRPSREDPDPFGTLSGAPKAHAAPSAMSQSQKAGEPQPPHVAPALSGGWPG